MECKILNALNFNILIPSSLAFYEILCYKLDMYKDNKYLNLMNILRNFIKRGFYFFI